MPFQIGTALNDFASKLKSNTYISLIAGNPLVLSIFISIVIFIILIIIIPGDKESYSTATKCSIWIFAVLLPLIFLQNRFLLDCRSINKTSHLFNKVIDMDNEIPQRIGGEDEDEEDEKVININKKNEFVEEIPKEFDEMSLYNPF